MSGFVLLGLAPFAVWAWRRELVNLVADCIAEGIRRSREKD
jgi:hypothetical protein